MSTPTSDPVLSALDPDLPPEPQATLPAGPDLADPDPGGAVAAPRPIGSVAHHRCDTDPAPITATPAPHEWI